MRKFLLPILCIVSLTACKKQSCWECTVSTAGSLSYREEFCDRSKKEIQHMQDNPLQTKDQATGEIIFSTSFSDCTRK